MLTSAKWMIIAGCLMLMSDSLATYLDLILPMILTFVLAPLGYLFLGVGLIITALKSPVYKKA